MRISVPCKLYCVMLVSALAPALLASPLKSPKRLINDRTADLTPLFHWWTNRAGPRPLTAWVHLTGEPVATNSFGWIIQASVESTGHSTNENRRSPAPGGSSRVLLQNPPLRDRAEFDRLKTELAGLNQQRTNLEAQAHAVAAEQNAVRHSGLRPRVVAAENRQLKAAQSEANTSLKSLDKQIQDVKKKLAVYPNPDQYVVDCFALETAAEYNRMPVYDHGFAAP